MSAALPEAGDAAASVRRSALMLHGVSAGDRAWLLERIEEPQRSQVRAMLRELRDLGIAPQDGEAVRAQAPRPEPAPSQPRELVMRADAPWLAKVLEEEPAPFVACLIQAGEWRWKAALVELLAPGKRFEVQELLRERAAPPKLGDAVVAAVAARLAVVPVPATPGRGAANAWREGFGRFAALARGGVRK